MNANSLEDLKMSEEEATRILSEGVQHLKILESLYIID